MAAKYRISLAPTPHDAHATLEPETIGKPPESPTIHVDKIELEEFAVLSRIIELASERKHEVESTAFNTTPQPLAPAYS